MSAAILTEVPSPYDAVLFDFDGVLVDSEPVHFLCWQQTLKPFGLHLDWDYYQSNCIGITDRAMLESLCVLSEPKLDMDLLWPEYPKKKARFREYMLAHLPIAQEVKALLEELAPLPMAIVTSSGRAEVEPILVAADIRKYFDATVYRESVTRYKPDPEPYALAGRLLGARNALVVEDSLPGAQSGCAAGWDVLKVKNAAEMPALLRARLATSSGA